MMNCFTGVLVWIFFQNISSAVFSSRQHRRLTSRVRVDRLLKCSRRIYEDSRTMSGETDLFRRIEDSLSRGLKLCIITRGAPGRGKTTSVQEIIRSCRNNGLFDIEMSAADDYMIDSSGNYNWSPEKLKSAHQSCLDKLVFAMKSGVDLVCQHNVNAQRWNSEELQRNAELLGYIVVFFEPKYSWTRRDKMPPEWRDVLVNSHGVSEEKIDYMISQKEEITPRYLAYWMRTSTFMKSFEDIGMSEEQFNKVLISFSSLHSSEFSKKEADEIADQVGFLNYAVGSKDKKTLTEYNLAESLNDAIVFVEKNFTAIADSNKSSLVKYIHAAQLPVMLHVTTDYLGVNNNFLQLADYQELLCDVLSPCTMQIVALFSDERGIGALVTHAVEEKNILTLEERTKRNIHDVKSINGDSTICSIPRYRKYTKKNNQREAKSGFKHAVPHITLRTFPGRNAFQIGEAASEFKELLSCHNILIAEEELSPLTAVSDIEKDQTSSRENVKQFDIVSIGKFHAVLFKVPVQFTGTYAYSYSPTTAKPESARTYKADRR